MFVSLIVAATIAASPQAELDAARDRWGARQDYSFRLQRFCFCAPKSTEPTRIRVRDGKAVDPPEHLERYATVPKLFAVVQDAIDSDVDELTVKYGKRGLPRSIYVDYDERIADEELTLKASRLRRR